MALAETREDRLGPDADHGTAKAIYYDALVQSLERARCAIASDDVEGRCTAVRDATEAVTSLFLVLKVPHSDLTPSSMGLLFNRALSCLLRINLHNDPKIAQAVIDLVAPLIDGHVADRSLRAGPDPLGQAQ